MTTRIIQVALISLVLVACSTAKTPDPAPAASPDDLTKVGEKIDKSDSRVAAAVTVAVENSDKPEVVKAEGKVALAYLPSPKEEDVKFARDRAAKADQKAYTAQIDYAKKMQTEVEKLWAKAEADAKKSKADIQALKDENTRLASELARVKKEASRDIWTIAGASLAVIGALAIAFVGVKIGLPLIIAGSFTGAVPHIIESEYFSWIAGGSLLACALLAIWRLYDYIRDKNNEPA